MMGFAFFAGIYDAEIQKYVAAQPAGDVLNFRGFCSAAGAVVVRRSCERRALRTWLLTN